METSTWNLMSVSPFCLTVLTNGLVTYNGLTYDFNNNGHNVAQQLQICPVFMVQFNHLNRLQNRRVFSSADLSKVLIIIRFCYKKYLTKTGFQL